MFKTEKIRLIREIRVQKNLWVIIIIVLEEYEREEGKEI